MHLFVEINKKKKEKNAWDSHQRGEQRTEVHTTDSRQALPHDLAFKNNIKKKTGPLAHSAFCSSAFCFTARISLIFSKGLPLIKLATFAQPKCNSDLMSM